MCVCVCWMCSALYYCKLCHGDVTDIKLVKKCRCCRTGLSSFTAFTILSSPLSFRIVPSARLSRGAAALSAQLP